MASKTTVTVRLTGGPFDGSTATITYDGLAVWRPNHPDADGWVGEYVEGRTESEWWWCGFEPSDLDEQGRLRCVWGPDR